MEFNFFAVVVLYNKKISESKTISTLREATKYKLPFNIHILIYDNSSQKSLDDFSIGSWEVEYYHNYLNPGICEAYNYALCKAQEKQFDWLFLFDDDSTISASYLEQMFNSVKDNFVKEFVVYVPRVICNSKIVSPIFRRNGLAYPIRSVDPKSFGAFSGLMAINSCCLFNVGFLAQIGGFNSDFPLDYLDHWLFSKLSSVDKKVWVVDVDVSHSLSVENFSDAVSIERYKSIAESEGLYYGKYCSRGVRFYNLCILFLRSVLFFLRFKDKRYGLITLRNMFFLLSRMGWRNLHSRKLLKK